MTTLADWLASDHDLAERLELIDNVCRALDEFHAREPRVRPALDPVGIGLTPELGVTLRASDPRESGEQVPEYRAPETVAGALYDPAVDSYSVGVLCYEILAGRHPFVLATPLGDIEAAADVPPPPLAGVRPDVPRDLAEAVMPCLERDPEWRPKDLSYLVETLRAARRTVPPAPRRKPAAAKAPAVKAPAVKAPAAKPAALEARVEGPLSARSAAPSSSRVPLIAAGIAGLVLVLGGLWYLTQPQQSPPATQASRSVAASAAPSSAAASPDTTAPGSVSAPADKPDANRKADASVPVTAAAPPTGGAATPAPRADGPAALAQVASTPPPAVSPAPVTATPAPRESARVAVVTPAPTPPAARPEAARPETARAEAPAARPGAGEPARPAVVTTLVPARLRRGATILVDVRGSDLRADLQPRILFKGRETAAGVQPIGQQLVNPTWLKVMLRIDTQAREGSYTLTLGDALGNVSNARTFEIGR